MFEDGRYSPPDLLPPDIINDIKESRHLYPPGQMDLLYDLTADGIELEVLQCRYLCKDGVTRSLLEIIDNEKFVIDSEQFERRLAVFKLFCDLEETLGTEVAMEEMSSHVTDITGEMFADVVGIEMPVPTVELQPATPITPAKAEASEVRLGGLGIGRSDLPPIPQLVTGNSGPVEYVRHKDDEHMIDLHVRDVQAIVFALGLTPMKDTPLAGSWRRIAKCRNPDASLGSPLIDQLYLLRDIRKVPPEPRSVGKKADVRAELHETFVRHLLRKKEMG
jgi:hypothetical protein